LFPPESVNQLMERAHRLAGRNLAELATEAGIEVPQNQKREKGWVGQLLEWHLGAQAGSRPEQDFPHLGVELKTLPLSSQGRPQESTFVCVAPLLQVCGLRWEQSNVRNKLATVLWLPIEADPQLPLAQRRVASPLLWRPSPAEEQLLRNDWENLMEQIALGQVEQISARQGEVLQLRPKAANSRALTRAIGPAGSTILTNPRGFYLRSQFTAAILAQFFQY